MPGPLFSIRMVVQAFLQSTRLILKFLRLTLYTVEKFIL
jgi:hypothetical protein